MHEFKIKGKLTEQQIKILLTLKLEPGQTLTLYCEPGESKTETVKQGIDAGGMLKAQYDRQAANMKKVPRR